VGAARRLLRAAGVSGWSSRLTRLQHEETSSRSQVEALLSPAEFRVAAAVAGGRTNREVADALFLSVKTVDFHLQAIYRKLGLRSRTELAVRMSGAVERRDTP
jgi:DNA-binding NarL/FixJ family response regulator